MKLRSGSALLLGALCSLVLGGADSYPTAASVPDFSGAWQRNAGAFDFSPPEPGIGPGPLVNTSGDRLVPVGNYDSPILKPWAAAEVKKHGDTLRSGKAAPDAHTSCHPMGLPYVLQVRENVQFLQTPDWIMIIYQNDNQRRLVKLNAPHSAHPAPSYFGESVGHYEGDTLVIDTVGIAIHDFSAIDRFGTPHTDAMHVVERYRIDDARKTMRADFTVDDPATFTTPWHGSALYVVGTPNPGEHICAENARTAGADGSSGETPIPVAGKPDF